MSPRFIQSYPDGVDLLTKVVQVDAEGNIVTPASGETSIELLNVLNQILAKIDVHVVGEVPAGIVDGANKVFTTSFQSKPGTTRVYVNGVRMREGPGFDYVDEVDHVTITFSVAPSDGDAVLVDYVKG